MNLQTNEIAIIAEHLKSLICKESTNRPLTNAAASQLTRIMCIANCCLDTVVEDAIDRYLENWRDIYALRQAPHVLFDHHAIGPLLKDIRLRKKRDENLAAERLNLLGVRIIDGSEFAPFNFDYFRVESVQPTSVPKYHHTACRVLTPAFKWTDQYGEAQLRNGSVVAFVFEPDRAAAGLKEVTCA